LYYAIELEKCQVCGQPSVVFWFSASGQNLEILRDPKDFQENQSQVHYPTAFHHEYHEWTNGTSFIEIVRDKSLGLRQKCRVARGWVGTSGGVEREVNDLTETIHVTGPP
jgi:hypothetical protein